MSACIRLPSRIGTMTLRSMMAMDSSSCSVALRRATVAASDVLACAGAAGATPGTMMLQTTARHTSFADRCIAASS